MIIVTVYLASAIDDSRSKELARMHISNAGETVDGVHFDYLAEVFRGRSKEQLDRNELQREEVVQNWPRDRLHVWNLVAAALSRMGYGDRGR